MSNIKETLDEREKTHGDFANHALISQKLKLAMFHSGCWEGLSNVQQEALEMIQHKVARILNGDSDYKDHWHDIAGYATLVEKELL